MSRLLAAPLAFVLLAPLPLSAETAPVLSETITVELVTVDVHVTDSHGRPIVGLGREAFRVLEDGQPVEISHFAWVPGGSAAADAERAPLAPGSDAMHLAVLFDELQIGDRSRQPLIEALRARLASRLRPGDRVSVSRFDGADVELLLQPTADRRRLDQALKQLGAFSSRRLLTGTEVRSSLETLQWDIVEQNCQNTAELLQVYATTVLNQVRHSAAALLRAAQRLAAEPGRRVLLHVSDGIPMIAGGEAYEYAIAMCDGTALAQGVAGAFDVAFDGADQESARDRFDPNKARLDFGQFSTATLWTDVAARVNTLGVTVYTLQAGDGGGRFLPEIEFGQAAPAARQFARENPRHTLAFVAAETGGLLLDASGVEFEALGRMIDDLGGYYTLAFSPPARARAGLRRIRVEVAASGARARYRQSYRLQGPHERIADQLASLFDLAQPDNPLGLRLTVASGKEPAPGSATVSVPLDQLALLEGADSTRAGRLTVFITLRKKGGAIVPVRSRTVDVLVPGAAPAPSVYTYRIDLPEAAAEVAVAVLDEFSGRLAFAWAREGQAPSGSGPGASEVRSRGR